MELSYLKALYNKGLVDVYDRFDTWQDAVRASVGPMVRAGMVEPDYGKSILDNVAENGPYIFLAPHICMPHSKNVELVREAGVCFVKVNEPVCYDKEDPEMGAELFFAIAPKELNGHLDAVMDLAEIFDDSETIDALLAAKTMADFEKLLG